jgi:hypothetical protein
MLLLTGSSSPLPDMGAVGQAAQHMNDQTAALYFMAVLLIALIIEKLLTGYRHGKTTERLAGAIDRLAGAIQSGDAQAMAMHAVMQNEMQSAARDRDKIARNLKDFNPAGRAP